MKRLLVVPALALAWGAAWKVLGGAGWAISRSAGVGLELETVLLASGLLGVAFGFLFGVAVVVRTWRKPSLRVCIIRFPAWTAVACALFATAVLAAGSEEAGPAELAFLLGLPLLGAASGVVSVLALRLADRRYSD